MTGRPVQIYALCTPGTCEPRYIGKANDAAARLRSHLRDARRRDTPVYRWVRKVVAAGQVPALIVLRECAADAWRSAEVEEIARARACGARLLNVAEGGDEPFCPPAVRADNGRRVAAMRCATPERRRIYEIKRQIGQARRNGWLRDDTKALLREAARVAPHLFGEWADIR